MKGNVEFWLGNLTTDPDTGLKVSCPDVYFENTGKKPNGETVVLSSAPVSSTIIIRQSFLDLIEAAEILRLHDDPTVKQARKVLVKMPKIEIGPNGEIRQWDRDIKNEWKEGDRTQLLVMVGAIYSNRIHPRKSPELSQALRLMLERRKSGLDGQGSWRASFPANTYARLGMGNQFHQVLTAHYRVWANPNLTSQFIQSEWMIDGNLGMMGAIQECLVQSHAGEIELLPALPDAWKAHGFVNGIAVRGGGTISFSWKNGIVTDWKLSGMKDKSVKIRINGKLND
jgi:alpha-L-fucosidase 2